MQLGKEVERPGESNPVAWELTDCGQQDRQPRGPGFVGAVDPIFEAHVEKIHQENGEPLGTLSFKPVVSLSGAFPTSAPGTWGQYVTQAACEVPVLAL